MLMMDAWMREAEEAVTTLEYVETAAKIKDVNRKVLELWVKLDRLETLLLNPPSKPVLTRKDLESRWELLLDIRVRTKAVATSLFAALPSSERSDRSDAGDASAAVISDSLHHVDAQGMISIKDDPELAMPLISNDATESPSKKKGSQLLTVMTCLSKSCWLFCIVLGGFTVLLTLYILSTFL